MQGDGYLRGQLYGAAAELLPVSHDELTKLQAQLILPSTGNDIGSVKNSNS